MELVGCLGKMALASETQSSVSPCVSPIALESAQTSSKASEKECVGPGWLQLAGAPAGHELGRAGPLGAWRGGASAFPQADAL